jgi:hypothetical protein
VIQVLLGHSKLETTALYTRIATNTIRAVMSPLDRLAPLTSIARAEQYSTCRHGRSERVSIKESFWGRGERQIVRSP